MRFKTLFATTPLAVLLFLEGGLIPPAAMAQVLKGQILGLVTDTTAAAVPGSQVKLANTSTGQLRYAKTNERGNYFFVNLDPGIYRIEAEQEGFSTSLQTGIDLQPNTTIRVNFVLSPGSVREVIDVSADAVPLLQTDRADTGAKLEQRQMQQMPLLYNRSYQGLLGLVPGVASITREHSEFYNSQESLSARVNGQGRQFNNFQIEGIENNIDYGHLTALVPPAEAIQTVDMSTSNFDPEFGVAGGAVVNVTIRSGTNNFHGSLFAFHRNENTQSRPYFANFKAPLVYNQFGGTIGGPIRRDKMFFFGDFQGSRDRLGQVNRPVIPGMAFRSGNLAGSPEAIYDPNTGDNLGNARVAFPGNMIPASRISPIARRILEFVPPPNVAAPEGRINYDRNTVRSKDLNQFDVKYDWVIGSNDRIAVRYSYQKALVFDVGLFGPEGIYGGPHANGFMGSGPARTQSSGVTYSKVWSPTFVWELRTGFVRNRNDAVNLDRGLTTASDVGIRSANVDEWSSGMSEIIIAGYTTPTVGFSRNMPWARAVTTYNVANNFTKTLSNHLLRFGADFRRERNDLLQTSTFNPRGRFEYAQGQTGSRADARRGIGNAFAAFLLDLPNRSGRDLALTFPARRELVQAYYVQDKWQVSSKLTVDLGLRYEVQSPATPRFPGGFSIYNSTNNTLELAGIGQNPMDGGLVKHWKNFGPRSGLAFRLNDKTVVRSGFGISFLQRRVEVFNYPVSQNNGFIALNTFVSSPITMGTGFPAAIVQAIPNDGVIRNPDPNSVFRNTPRDLPVGYVQSWNFAIQRALPGRFAVEASYVGNHGVNNETEWNANAAVAPGTGNAGRPLFRQFGRSADTISTIGTHTYYNSLQVKLDRRFHTGIFLTTSYTWGKSLNFNNDIQDILIAFAVPLNKGRDDANRTHIYTQSWIYQLPFGRGKKHFQSGPASRLLGGWQVQGLLSLTSGASCKTN